MRYTPAGVPVADFTLATNRRWTNKTATPRNARLVQDHLLAQTGRVAAQYVRKGKLILVESDEIVASAFIGKDDEPHATLEITAASFKFLGGRRDDAENSTGETNVLEIGGDTEIPF